MKKFESIEMEPARITMRLKGKVTAYKIFGYALVQRKEEEGTIVEYTVLQPSDMRCNPVVRVPSHMVLSITAEY